MYISFNEIKSFLVSDVVEFIHTLKLEDVFKKVYKVDIDSMDAFDKIDSDEDVVFQMLTNHMNSDFLWHYEFHDETNEQDSHFHIYQIDRRKPIKISGKVILANEKVILT